MGKRSFSSGLQSIFTPELGIFFLIGTLAMAVLGNACFQLLLNWLGISTPAVLKIAVGALFVLGISAWIVTRLAFRLRPLPVRMGKQAPDRHRGLILLVSRQEPCEKAIQWHEQTLSYCRLVCSAETAPVADALIQKLQRKNVDAKRVVVNDVYDPLEVRDEVERIYAGLPPDLSASEVILDFTGMTTTASVGSVLACLYRDGPMQYTPAWYDKKLEAMQALDPIQIVINNQAPVQPAVAIVTDKHKSDSQKSVQKISR